MLFFYALLSTALCTPTYPPRELPRERTSGSASRISHGKRSDSGTPARPALPASPAHPHPWRYPHIEPPREGARERPQHARPHGPPMPHIHTPTHHSIPAPPRPTHDRAAQSCNPRPLHASAASLSILSKLIFSPLLPFDHRYTHPQPHLRIRPHSAPIHAFAA